MASKLHCDVCDAVIPDDQDYVYMIRKNDYQNRDWRYGTPAVACYPCLAVILPSLPEQVRQHAAEGGATLNPLPGCGS